jgi:UDP-glucose 4-epimerase
MYDNISIVDNLVETFRKAPPSKMVFLSSVEVYGLAKQLPITERTPFEPETLYGIGKAASELVLKRWQRKSQGSLALLRLPGIYGPGDTSGGLIFHIVNSITEGRPFSLNGDGSDLRDYVFVEDVARIVAALGEEEFSELTLNLATGNSLSLVNILETAQQVFGPCEVQRGKRTQEAQDISFDTSELRKVLPNITMKTLREGFERTQDSLIEQRNDNV